MKSLNNEYRRLLQQEENESIGAAIECNFENAQIAKEDAATFVNNNITKTLEERKELEQEYHELIFLQLIHNLDEMKFYSDVDVNSTRRMVSVNNDCLSLVQVLIRDEIHVQAYFRSSDLKGALPIDLEFLAKIPSKLINKLTDRCKLDGYDEINREYIEELSHKPVRLKVTFGSLHKKSGY